jgi:hypothetical protein
LSIEFIVIPSFITIIVLDLIQHFPIVNALTEIRKHTTVLLPIGHSFIPFDILLAVVKGNAEGRDLTVKSLFTALPYSDMGIRYHFRTLIKNGWIELHNGDKDTRVRRVRPTEKLIKRFSLLSQQLKPLFD